MEQKKDAQTDQSEPRQLTSWKEIAHYLGVNIRTAQKWERDRRLPVSRFSGARGRISADAARLEAWKRDIAQISNHDDRCYRWPLPGNVIAEVRFVGGRLTPAHVDLLLDYLNLAKTAL